MTIEIKTTSDATVITTSGASAPVERVEIVPGSIHEGQAELGGGATVSGIVLTVRPA